jgi:hypothetical protein
MNIRVTIIACLIVVYTSVVMATFDRGQIDNAIVRPAGASAARTVDVIVAAAGGVAATAQRSGLKQQSPCGEMNDSAFLSRYR